MRTDARRNVDSLLRTALEVFAESGVDAPVRTIAKRAGVGVLYRPFSPLGLAPLTLENRILMAPTIRGRTGEGTALRSERTITTLVPNDRRDSPRRRSDDVLPG